MNITEKLSNENALKEWITLTNNCENLQKDVLKEILSINKNTEFGKSHNFENIKSIEDYRRNVPITEYSDLSEYIDKMANGQKNILFSGRTKFFISTSGTTGNSKFIPESRKGMDIKNLVLKLRSGFLMNEIVKNCKNSDLVNSLLSKKLKPFFYSVQTVSHDKTTNGGISIGFASGKALETFETNDIIQLAYPKNVNDVKNTEASIYLSLLFGLIHKNVVLTIANNFNSLIQRFEYCKIHAKELIKDIRMGSISKKIDLSSNERKIFESLITPKPERADVLEKIMKKGSEEFIPKNYWSSLIAGSFWLSGSVGINVDKIKKYFSEDMIYFDFGYGASEGKMTIPHIKDVGFGTLATFGGFFEFIDLDSNEILSAWELKEGSEYEIILTTYSGLYRYKIHDIIKVCGFLGDTPDIEFISKSKEILNISQEKVPASLLSKLLFEFGKKRNIDIIQSQVYPNLDGSYYEIFIEIAKDDPCLDLNIFSKDFDDCLVHNFESYGRHRELKTIKPLNVYLVKKGYQNHLYGIEKFKNMVKEQIKLPIMINKRIGDEWILEQENVN
ncbi:MAG: GH3 auxin-responsive promoter family protein [Methanobrevibacter sp.]|jgi:hypothetical protein|nr:GH3 auxin-responsive promoter family protein [Candidatus Methanovirga basalitermitum]